MKLMALLPFMDEEEIQELATKIINGEVKGISLITVFPFLDGDSIDAIVKELIEKKQYKELYGALPFLKQSTLDHLYQTIKDGNLEGFKEEALLPFLGKDQLKGLFDTLVKEAMSEAKQAAEDSVADLFQEDDTADE